MVCTSRYLHGRYFRRASEHHGKNINYATVKIGFLKYLYDIRWKYFGIFIFLVFHFFLIVNPSIMLRLILKIKRNTFFGCPCKYPTYKIELFFQNPVFSEILKYFFKTFISVQSNVVDL